MGTDLISKHPHIGNSHFQSVRRQIHVQRIAKIINRCPVFCDQRSCRVIKINPGYLFIFQNNRNHTLAGYSRFLYRKPGLKFSSQSIFFVYINLCSLLICDHGCRSADIYKRCLHAECTAPKHLGFAVYTGHTIGTVFQKIISKLQIFRAADIIFFHTVCRNIGTSRMKKQKCTQTKQHNAKYTHCQDISVFYQVFMFFYLCPEIFLFLWIWCHFKSFDPDIRIFLCFLKKNLLFIFFFLKEFF